MGRSTSDVVATRVARRAREEEGSPSASTAPRSRTGLSGTAKREAVQMQQGSAKQGSTSCSTEQGSTSRCASCSSVFAAGRRLWVGAARRGLSPSPCRAAAACRASGPNETGAKPENTLQRSKG